MSIINQQFQLNLDRVGILIPAITVENTIQLVKIFTKKLILSEENLYCFLDEKPFTVDCAQGSLTIVNSQQGNFDKGYLLDIYIMPMSLYL